MENTNFNMGQYVAPPEDRFEDKHSTKKPNNRRNTCYFAGNNGYSRFLFGIYQKRNYPFGYDAVWNTISSFNHMGNL